MLFGQFTSLVSKYVEFNPLLFVAIIIFSTVTFTRSLCYEIIESKQVPKVSSPFLERFPTKKNAGCTNASHDFPSLTPINQIFSDG